MRAIALWGFAAVAADCGAGTEAGTLRGGPVDACAACPPGHVKKRRGPHPCRPCGPGTEPDADARECRACGENSWSNGTSCRGCLETFGPGCPTCPPRAEYRKGVGCVCFRGHYGPSCDPCPPGASCTDGQLSVQAGYQNVSRYLAVQTGAAARASFSRLTEESSARQGEVALCYTPDACLGGPAASCAEGSFGVLCDACETLYYQRRAPLACSKCPSTFASLVTAGVTMLCVATVALGFVIAMAVNWLAMKAIALRIAFNHLFVFSTVWIVCPVFHSFDLLLPLLEFLAVVDAPQNGGIKIACVLTSLGFDAYMAIDRLRLLMSAVLVPGLTIVVLCAAYATEFAIVQLTPYRPKLQPWARGFVLAIAWLLYQMIARELMTAEVCVPIAGQRVRRVDLSTPCPDPGSGWAVFTRICVLQHVVGIPLIIAGFLVKFRRILVSRNVRRVLGLFYFGYEPRWTYWELAVFARKAMLLYIVISDLPFRERQILVLLVCVLALLGQALADPFDNRAHKQLDTLEQVGLAGNIVTLLIALFMDSRASHVLGECGPDVARPHPFCWLYNDFFEYVLVGVSLLPHVYFNLLVLLALVRVNPDPMAKRASVVALDVKDDSPPKLLLNVSSLSRRDRSFLTVVLTDCIALHNTNLDQFTFQYVEAAIFYAMVKLRGTNRNNWRSGVQELHDQLLKQNSFPAKPYFLNPLFVVPVGSTGKAAEVLSRPDKLKVWDKWLEKTPGDAEEVTGAALNPAEAEAHDTYDQETEVWRPPEWIQHQAGKGKAGAVEGGQWTASMAFLDHAPTTVDLERRFGPLDERAQTAAPRPGPMARSPPPELPDHRGVLEIQL